MNPDEANDRALLATLVAELRGIEPEIRTGAMFGCPAAFVGPRMAFCVYRGAVGAKLPQADAAGLIAAGEAAAFRPFGRSPMREWVELPAVPGEALHRTLALAVRYARTLA